MYEFGIPIKLISLKKSVHEWHKISSKSWQRTIRWIPSGNRLKARWRSLTTTVQYCTSVSCKSIQRDNCGINIRAKKIGILGFADK